MPELVANHLPSDREIILHSENGVLGIGPKPGTDALDPDLINADKQPVTLIQGGSFFDHNLSFTMMRGGHLDIAILGAYQVSERGDLANWSTGKKGTVPAVGGAMDLAIGAKKVFVMMECLTKEGHSKIVRQCTYPLTGLGCGGRVYTDLAVLDVTDEGFAIQALYPGMTKTQFETLTGLVFH